MAPRAKKNEIAKKAPSTDLATIDQELNKEIASIKDQISQPSGNRIKVSNDGSFQLPDGTDLGNQIRLVIVDFVSANRYYPVPYNPNNIQPPTCFAYGKEIATMVPHDKSHSKESDACAGCPMNQFKSAVNGGAGKACKNTRDLAVLLDMPDSGYALDDPNAELFTFSVSPKNIKAFDGAIAACGRVVGHYLKGVFNVSGEPANAGPNNTYALVKWGDIEANEHYGLHASRRAEAKERLETIPDYSALNATPTARGKGAPARRAPGAAARR